MADPNVMWISMYHVTKPNKHKNGPVKTEAIGPQNPEFHYIAAAIYLVRKKLRAPEAIEYLARTMDLTVKHKDYKGPHQNQIPLKWITEEFLPKVEKEFPVVYIDERLDSAVGVLHKHEITPEFAACWHNAYIVGVSATQVEKMIKAVRRKDVNDFRLFMFSFLQTFFHEIAGHDVIANLTMGRGYTQEGIQAHPDITQNEGPESGEHLKWKLIGGTLASMAKAHHAHPHEQPGIPALAVKEHDDDEALVHHITTLHIQKELKGGKFCGGTLWGTPCR